MEEINETLKKLNQLCDQLIELLIKTYIITELLILFIS